MRKRGMLSLVLGLLLAGGGRADPPDATGKAQDQEQRRQSPPIKRADSLYGTCKYQDGSRVDGKKITISTSWNQIKVSPKKGTYRLNFAEPVDRIITVYVNRRWYKLVFVRGNTRLDIVLPKPKPAASQAREAGTASSSTPMSRFARSKDQ